MEIDTLSRISKIASYSLATIIVFYVLVSNLFPFGVSEYYTSNKDKEISALGPTDRVLKLETQEGPIYKQINDLVYFTTIMPLKFDKAKVKITFQNSYDNQQLSIGFQDQNKWHYDDALINIPFLDLPNWHIFKGSPNIIQKGNKYQSLEEILNDPSRPLIGSYHLDTNTFAISKVKIPNYRVSGKDTVIDIPLRGKQILYAYLEKEPFKMWVTKQDLNWYEDPDPVNIKIYKDNVVVYSAFIDDDGIDDASGKVFLSQQTFIQNPGPGLPEDGVYKIVIDGSEDTIITSIKTNLNRIVFEGPMYLASNSLVFPKINKATTSNLLFTNAKIVTAKTYHKIALQEIKVASEGAEIKDIIATRSVTSKTKLASDSAKVIKLDSLDTLSATESATQISQVYIPESDVVLNGSSGYFALSKDQLFYPTAYSILPITSPEDLTRVNYILTDYDPPAIEGNWKVAETEFDLSSAFIKNGKLSWLIKAPGLKENGREIIIKKIEVSLYKKPISLPF